MVTRVAVLTTDPAGARALVSGLASRDLSCLVSPLDLPDGDIDLVVADLDGSPVTPAHETLLRHIRDQRRLPVIALIDEVAAGELEPALEVDDFVVKPVRVDELATRIRRVLSRAQRPADDLYIRCGNLTIDMDAYQVFVDGEAIDLTFKEYELLRFLAANPGRAFSREALLRRVWDYDYYGGERTVDVHVRRLRSKIEVGDQTFIETVRGVGYRFKGSLGKASRP